MKPIEIRLREKPDCKNAILVCGLPDSGLVARLAIEKLTKATGARLIAEIYSTYFPPGTMIERDGTTRLMRNEIHYAKLEPQDLHLLLYTGDTQPQHPAGAYELAESVLETARSLGAEEAIILAAYIRGHEVEEPKVYGTATDPLLAQKYMEHGVLLSEEGYITWMHGLLLGLCRLKGIRAICLSGETPGDRLDPAAASALLSVLERALGLKLEGEREEGAGAPSNQEEDSRGGDGRTLYIG